VQTTEMCSVALQLLVYGVVAVHVMTSKHWMCFENSTATQNVLDSSQLLHAHICS